MFDAQLRLLDYSGKLEMNTAQTNCAFKSCVIDSTISKNITLFHAVGNLLGIICESVNARRRLETGKKNLGCRWLSAR